MIIAIDFDGTCVTHEYPKIGKDIGAVPVLRALAREHSLILWTMRSGKELSEAVEWLTTRGIALFGINNNPGQASWTKSPKAYANLYIDDAALGCPLVRGAGDRPFVNWDRVGRMLVERGILKDVDDSGA